MGFLKNKKVVLLGGSSGIGLATAKAAAENGASIIIVSSNQNRINAALRELPENSKGYAVDLNNERQVEDLFNEIGTFDHLVYTAGENIQLATLEDIEVEAAKKYFNLRYWGALTAVKYASDHVNKDGSIVLTSGIAGARPNKGWALGASICSAMEGFTRAMAIELAPIRVNIVSPGVVKTNLWAGMSEDERNGMYEQTGNSLPVRRVGEADDIAQAYIYLMRQQFGTGQTLVADGGAVLV